MENKSHAMAAGSFVLVLVILLGALALWLTRDRESYVTYEMSTADAISGLQKQAAVRYKGVAVGKVTDITFDEVHPGNVLIRIAVDTLAPVSATTTYGILGYQGVTGIAHIQLDDLSPALAQPLPVGADGIARLPMKSSPLTVLADQGMTILSRVSEATDRINELLKPENQAHFSQLLENLSQTASHVNQITQAMTTTLSEDVAPALKEFPAIAQDTRKVLEAMEHAGVATSALAEDVRQMTSAMQAPGGALDQVTRGAQSMARAAERLDRATLPSINQAASDVSGAAKQLGSAAAGIRENPQALFFGMNQRPGPGEVGFVAPTPAPAP